MTIEILKALFSRDLNKLKQEIELYKTERSIWNIEKGITNSAGNLCLHLIGNLKTYIGAELGSTKYIRDRALEFSSRDISKTELIKNIDETIIIVETTLDKLTIAQLTDEFPVLVFDNKTSTEYLLVHLTTHLAYHLGQINYHRRLLDSE